MVVKSQKDLKGLQEIGVIVANCLKLMLQEASVGMSTKELDNFGASYLRQHGALSAPISTYNFPGTTCISLNRVIAHGIPSDKIFMQEGDILNVDVSASKNGLFADTGATIVLGDGDPEHKRLCVASHKALKEAMKAAKAERGLNVVGKAIQKEAFKNGFKVIRNLCSHGIGRALHELPDYIPGFDDPKEKRILVENQVMTIEPFLSTGTTHAEYDSDGWSLINEKGHYSAQFEHTMVITKKSPIILTQPDL